MITHVTDGQVYQDPGHRTAQDIEYWAAYLNFQGRLPKFTSETQDPLTQAAVVWHQHHQFTGDLPYVQAMFNLMVHHEPIHNLSLVLVEHLTPDAQAWLTVQLVGLQQTV